MINNPTQRRALILQFTLEEINRTGLRGFTVDRLAKKMGISKKTIYALFPTKDILVGSAFHQIHLKVDEEIRIIISKPGNPIQQFFEIVNIAQSIIGGVQVEVINELKMKYPAIWTQIDAYRGEIVDVFTDLLLRAKKMGMIRDDINIKTVALLHANIVHRIFRPEVIMESNLTITDTIQTYKTLLTGGILSEEGREQLKNNL